MFGFLGHTRHGTDLDAHAPRDVVEEGLDLGLAVLHVGRLGA